MAWKKRGNKSYYYFSRRIGDRVRTLYLGNGPVADVAALRVDEERANRELERAELTRSAPFERTLESFNTVCSALLSAEMTAAGYHRHDRGAWRRRHGH